MPYNEAHFTEILHLKVLSESVRAELDDLLDVNKTLSTQLETLEARYDANVTASTDADADYAAEVVDARVDALGNPYASLGANIRAGQQELSDAIATLEETQGTLVSNDEQQKEEISNEASERRDDEFMVDIQLQELSEAVLRLSVMVWDIREKLRGLT